jgi:two-component system sensor histidine kinase/response regulator
MGSNDSDQLNALRSTLGKMEIALGAINDAIVWTNEKGLIQWCNKSFDELLGVVHITILGKPLAEVMPLSEHGLQLPRSAHPVQKVLESRTDVKGYYEMPKHGAPLFIEFEGEYVEFSSGEHSAVIVLRDMSEARELEQVRVQSIALQAAANAIVITDRKGGVIWINKAFTHLTGYDSEEILGNPIEILQSGEHDEDYYQNLWRTILSGEVWEGEIINRKKDGNTYLEMQTITPVLDSRRDITHFIAIKQDITEQKKAAEALEKAIEDAETANQAKSEFLANMSHEIRTPMNAIVGMTELVLDTELNDEQLDYLKTVKSSAFSLLNIINDILDFSKIEAGKLGLEKISFNLSDRLQNTLKMLSLRAHKKGLELVYHEHPGIPKKLMGDPERLNQIIVNLVGNALKFTEKGEIKVEIATVTEGGEILSGAGDVNDHVTLKFSVEDTGIGISPEKQTMIFEAFTQADSFTTRIFGGTGLGLAITKHLVEIMGGRIWLESEEGSGATFFFTIPFEVEEVDAPKEMPAFMRKLERSSVLVAEGKPKSRNVYEELFRYWRMASTVCEDLPSALSLVKGAVAKGHPFDLFILDAALFHEKSQGSLEEILSDTELNLPVIFVLPPGVKTRHVDACRFAGVSFCLTKPITPSDMMDAVLRAHGLDLEVPKKGEEGPPMLSHKAFSINILLAEDNPVNQKLAMRVLEKMGHRVTVVGNGRDAFETLRKAAYDVVLMDVQMPVMDGLTATAMIREAETETGGHVPIIAMTANAMQGDRERCLEAGMDDYLPKPIRFQDLADVLQKHSNASKSNDG